MWSANVIYLQWGGYRSLIHLKHEHRMWLTAPLYMLLLSSAPLYPIEIYCLAAKFNLEKLAVNSSSHLLSFPLSSITDEMALRMGAVYLKRLMCLHHGRNGALRDILLVPPLPHPQTKECSFADQKRLTRAWALVSAYLAWEARSGNFLNAGPSSTHFLS